MLELRDQVNRKRARRQGFALLIVMILIVLLAVLVFAFQRDVMREVSISANVRDDLKAAYMAQMALVRGQVILRLDEHADYDSLNEDWAQQISWTGETWGADDSSGSEQTPPPPPKIQITDEERKFCLLSLVRGNELQRERATKVLKRLIEICRREDERLALDGDVKTVRRANDQTVNTDTLVKNLVKYLEERASEDSDDLVITANPNEKPDVRSMKKQTPFEMLTVGELLQVEGWTEELLYGPVRRADEAMEARTEEEEPARDWKDLTDEEKFEQRRTNVESIDQRSSDPNPLPLLGFITLYSTGFVNINTAPREVLLALDEKLTWDVVEKILTAREQDRQDVIAAEENGGTLPEAEPDPNLDPNAPAEEEDKASFRPQDLANYQAFVQRVNNQQTQEGEQPAAEIEGFTEEIYNAIRPWLVVRSTVFEVLASSTIGKVTHTIRAVYRRTADPSAQPAQPATDAGTDGSAATDGGTGEEDSLPSEPTMKLTLLFRDVSSGS
ncbi:MAG: general secretion pathway protein GspK [Planctomycetes bacterium]|nr:general secretion pathway protein GspK [Planctomycetota bacterium]MCB9934151.1 general secretion pathway protein GspK [Planctomycetota bacterium]